MRRLSRWASVARLAPSKHNSQPWRFTLSDGGLQVWPDRTRRLPVTDPDDRELMIACGAAVLAAQIAAEADGTRLDVTWLPDGLQGPSAALEQGGSRPVTSRARRRLVAVLRRRTDRGPLDATALDLRTPVRLQAAAERHGCVLRLVRAPGELATVRRLVEEADAELLRSPAVRAELAAWTAQEHAERRDGVPATATRGPASRTAAFVQRDFSLPGSPAHHDRAGVDAPLIAVLCSPSDSTVDLLRTGAALLEVLVTATLDGAAASYVDQPVELPRTRGSLQAELGLPGVPQLVLRLGAGGRVAPTVRRSLPDLLVRP